MSAASLGDQSKLSVAPSGGGVRDGLGTGSRLGLQAPPEDEEEDEGIQSDEEEVQTLLLHDANLCWGYWVLFNCVCCGLQLKVCM